MYYILDLSEKKSINIASHNSISIIIRTAVVNRRVIMRVVFIPPSQDEFKKLFMRSPLKHGGGLSDISIFSPHISNRRGGGVLSTLSGIARKVFPFMIKTLKPVAKQFGASVLNDVISGRRDFKTSLKKNGIKALKKSGSRILRPSGRVTKNRRRTKKVKKRRGYKTSVFDIV